jgi:flagellar hook-length control protein FliK
MTTFIAPSAGPTAPSQPLTSSGPRGRPADEPQGQRFGDVLERSRATGARKSEASPDAPPAEAAALQKPDRGADKKEELVSDLLAFALFAPATVAVQPASVAAPAAGVPPGEAKAELSMAADVAQDPLLAQTPATALTEAGTEAAAKPLPTAQDAGPEAKTLPAQAAAAQADIAKAVPAAADASVAAAAPAAVAATPLPPAASALPSAKATAAGAGVPASATPQQAKASPALPSADEMKTAPAPAAATSTERADTAAAQSPASPTLVPTSTSFMPQAVERSSAPASPTPVLSVAPPVGSDEWGPAVGQQMLRMNAGGHQVAELNLNPAGLGPLKVTLSLGDNQAQAMFVSAHESVRKAVEAALPQLRSTLAEQGISLGQTSVGAESRPWAGQGGGFGQPSQQQHASSSRQADYPGAGRVDAAAVAAPRNAPATQRSSGLDTFA